MHRLHFFGGHALYWRGIAALVGIGVFVVLIGVYHIARAIWRHRQRRREVEWF